MIVGSSMQNKYIVLVTPSFHQSGGCGLSIDVLQQKPMGQVTLTSVLVGLGAQ